ncbi:hypothetical protein AMECASPLE_026160 [Ameca splendens]|uniref:Secreted protein n=1 Tax=Ameca splendens TaxID=208324 RepID=A0ABV0ZR27_9TELE
MLPALRRLSVLPLWFSFWTQLKLLWRTYPTSLSMSRFQVWIQSQVQLAATGLHTLSFHRAKPVHPPASGTSGLRLKGSTESKF